MKGLETLNHCVVKRESNGCALISCDSPDTVVNIPEGVTRMSGVAFKEVPQVKHIIFSKCGIPHFVTGTGVPNGFMDIDIGCLHPNNIEVVSVVDAENNIQVDLPNLVNWCKKLREINIRCKTPVEVALRGSFKYENKLTINIYGAKKVTCDALVDRVLRRISMTRGDKYEQVNFQDAICVRVHGTSMGRVDIPLRAHVVLDCLENMNDRSLYSEKEVAAIIKWFNGCGKSFFAYLCRNYGPESDREAVAKILSNPAVKLPRATYEAIIALADDKRNCALKPVAMEKLRQYYDVNKIKGRCETIALNDLKNPDRAHAMKKLWSWRDNEDGTITVLKCKTPEMEICAVPSVICGKTVTCIGDGAFRNMRAKEIIIPETVTEMGQRVFCGNKTLEKVAIKGPVRVIGYKTFSECNKLYEVELPDTVEFIEERAFHMCGIRRFVSPKNLRVIGDECFYGSYLEYAEVHNAILGAGVFSYSNTVKCVLKNVAVVPAFTFTRCVFLEEVDARSAYRFSKGAMTFCGRLQSLHVGECLSSVDGWCISGEAKKVTIYYPESKKAGKYEAIFQKQKTEKINYAVDVTPAP